MSRGLPIRLRAGALLAVAAVLWGACGRDDPTVTAPSRPTPTSTTANGVTVCDAPTYTVEYPSGWSTNTAQDGAPCRWFHPGPFELPENSEATGIAIHVRYEAVEFRAVADPANRSEDVLAVEETQLDGIEAVRMRTRSRGEGLLDAGVEIVNWFANTRSHTFAATTTGAAEGSLEANTDVLDQMMRSLRFKSAPCSAVEQRSLSDLPSDVPNAVAETRRRLFDAARACDYDRLANLSKQGNRQFTFSFGGSDDPAAHWRTEEQQGRDPLRKLAAILDLTHATLGTEGDTQFLWPAAFKYESWNEVPERERRELARAYTPDEIEGFERAGAYLGYRVGIAEDGEWLFFVAGD